MNKCFFSPEMQEFVLGGYMLLGALMFWMSFKIAMTNIRKQVPVKARKPQKLHRR